MKRTLQAYWPSIRKYVFLLVATTLSMALLITLRSFSPYYIRDIVNVFTNPKPDLAVAKHIFFQLLQLFVIIWVAHRLFEWLIALYEAKVMCDLDQRSFAAIQAQSIRFFENSFSGSLVKYVTRFRNSFEGLSDIFLLELGQNFLALCLALGIFLYEKPILALAFGIWSVVFLAFSYGVAIWKYPLDVANAKSDTRVGGALADSIGNHLTVKSFGYERSEQVYFNAVVYENYQKRLRSWLASNYITAAQGGIVISAELGLIWWLINGWQEGTVTAGDFIFYQSYVLTIMEQLWPFGRAIRRLFQYVADAEEMTDIYHAVPEVKDAPGAHSLHITEGQIDIHSLSFSYGDTNGSTVLHGFNLHIPANQTIGLVGKTGAGKSTLVKLLLRLYDINSGYIRIDMQDIADVTQESLRQQIATVPQHPQLFHRTIAENIAFARNDASEEEVVEAARLAHALEFIEKMPHGFKTIVGERGVKLSGGQAQRIAIARAILSDSRILILDEATSALDSETEKYIQAAIGNLLQRRTSIVIAHRLSTLMKLDRIVVVEHGQIIEDGTHQQLLDQNGHYANLWNHQVGGYIS